MEISRFSPFDSLKEKLRKQETQSKKFFENLRIYTLVLTRRRKKMILIVSEVEMLNIKLGPDYMENLSPGSQRNPPKMKVAITRRRFQSGLTTW